METKQLTDDEILAAAARNGFVDAFGEKVYWERSGLTVRIHGWRPATHCWSFMDLEAK